MPCPGRLWTDTPMLPCPGVPPVPALFPEAGAFEPPGLPWLNPELEPTLLAEELGNPEDPGDTGELVDPDEPEELEEPDEPDDGLFEPGT